MNEQLRLEVREGEHEEEVLIAEILGFARKVVAIARGSWKFAVREFVDA